VSVNDAPDAQTTVREARSFVEEARRAQLVACAIDVLAEQGFSQASSGRIADRAGVSRALINYHFRGRDDLIRAVVAEVYARGLEHVGSRVVAEETQPAMLRAFIEGSVDFYRAYPRHMQALRQIVLGARTGPPPHRDRQDREVSDVGDILRDGQRTGEFRDFDPAIMAITIRHALNGLLDEWDADPGLDLEVYRGELADLFDAATRARDAT
jgi:AcrR family transcriptional regulator